MIAKDILRTFFRLYPHQPATAFWRGVEITALTHRGIPAGRGLDLGCGDGILTSVILGKTGPRDLVGVDLDPLETSLASRFSFYSAVHTCAADDIPEQDASFDFVISNSVLEHIPVVEPVIEEIHRLLRPGGRFLFTVPAGGFHRNLRGPTDRSQSRSDYLQEIDERLAHFHYRDPSEWRTLCGGIGLIIDFCEGYFDEWETRRWETLSRYTGGMLYRAFRRRHSPIEIQRRLGARDTRFQFKLPSFASELLARATTHGLPATQTPWVPATQASCLLVEGHRPP